MSRHIISRIHSAFDEALRSGALLFFPSTVHVHQEAGVQFQVRLCPALQHKPQLPTPHFERTPEHDPFAPPYITQLLVEDELEVDGSSYVIMLNKYSVIPKHFLLVTKEFQSQSSPLLPSDLLQTYLLLVEARQIGQNFLAFYNCGNLSGASQYHKHVQFLPVDEGDPPVEKVAKSQNVEVPTKPFSLAAVPYTNFVYRLPSLLPSSSREFMLETLSQAFLQLIDLVIDAMRTSPLPLQIPGPPSYNVLITLDHIHVIPRSKETCSYSTNDGSISVNALGYAGMLLVKNDEEMDAVKREGVMNILSDVGLPKLEEEAVD